MDNCSGMLLIISGPSGSGKGTVVKKLDPKKGFALSISLTTREPREGERDGKDYFFCTEEEFFEKRNKGELLEHAVFCNNYYGTPGYYVDEQIAKGKTVVLEIEVYGALQVREKYPQAVLIFLIPPTMEELKRRLISRDTEDMEVINNRLQKSWEEIGLIENYDYIVINDEVSEAVREIYTIVDAEHMKPHRRLNAIKNFKGEKDNATTLVYGTDGEA